MNNSNKEIIIIVGLPGSGKSYLIHNEYNDSSKNVVFDDLKAHSIFDNPEFTYNRNYPEIINEIKSANNNIVLSDIDFCCFNQFSSAKAILNWWINNFNNRYLITTIAYENSKAKCINNINKTNGRDRTSRIDMINKYSLVYNPEKYVENVNNIKEIYGI
jgi:hypothetical protein